MAKTIIVDGVEYVAKTTESDRIIVTCAFGWIYIGERSKDDKSDNGIRLTNASVVRKWSNGKGIGGLATAALKDDYTLDSVGMIDIPNTAVLSVIYCDW
jgi:hypothetical protein